MPRAAWPRFPSHATSRQCRAEVLPLPLVIQLNSRWSQTPSSVFDGRLPDEFSTHADARLASRPFRLSTPLPRKAPPLRVRTGRRILIRIMRNVGAVKEPGAADSHGSRVEQVTVWGRGGIADYNLPGSTPFRRADLRSNLTPRPPTNLPITSS